MFKFCNGGFVIWPYMFSSKSLCPFLPYSHTLRSNANSSGSQVSPANLQSGLQPTSAMVSWAQMMHQPSWSQMCWQTCWHHWVPSDCMSIWKAALYMWSCVALTYELHWQITVKTFQPNMFLVWNSKWKPIHHFVNICQKIKCIWSCFLQDTRTKALCETT